jgi:uncharacterized protein (DUF697 family)
MDEEYLYPGETATPPETSVIGDMGALHGLAGGADWQQVQEEVSSEMVGRIALTGLPGTGKRALLALMRGRGPSHPSSAQPHTNIQHDGFFLIVDIPDEADADEEEFLLDFLQTVDLILYIVDGETGPQEQDSRWVSLIRSHGMKLIGILGRTDPLENPRQAALEYGQTLNLRLTPLSTGHRRSQELKTLMEQILKARPGLGLALAREVPLARPLVTERIIRQSALNAALLGATPAPLLDLPLQVTNHMRMALRIGAAHGQPGVDYLSREIIGAAGASLGLRYLIQQAVRMIPILGWMINAGVNAISTYLLGRTLVAYYAANWDALSGKEILSSSNPLPKIVRIIQSPPDIPWPQRPKTPLPEKPSFASFKQRLHRFKPHHHRNNGRSRHESAQTPYS